MNEPLVSVIMPAYNSEKFIGYSINSVINQTYSNWELWIVDDGSKDGTKDTVNSFAKTDLRIKPVFLEQNSGTAHARNIAIERSNGKYIAFLDADDIWLEEKLSTQVSFMEENNYLFSFSWYDVVDAFGATTNKIIRAPSTVGYKRLLKNNTIGCLTAMYNSEKLGKLKMPLIRKRQDYGLWLNILKTGVVAHCIPKLLAHYRTGTGSLSGKKLNVLRYNWEILRKHQQLSFFSSAYYFGCYILNKSLKYGRR
ncbi:MAG: glycosyltransferase family 2 protein [Chitinophagales bacterium]